MFWDGAYALHPVWKDCLFAWIGAAIIGIAIYPVPFPNTMAIGLAAALISAGSYRAGFYVALGKVKQQSDKEKSDEQSEIAEVSLGKEEKWDDGL